MFTIAPANKKVSNRMVRFSPVAVLTRCIQSHGGMWCTARLIHVSLVIQVVGTTTLQSTMERNAEAAGRFFI